MIKKTSLSLLMLAASSVSSFATISFNIDGDLLKDSAGTAISQNSLFLLVSSTTDSTFDAITANSATAVGSLLNTDDRILYRGDLTGYGANGVLNTSTPGLALNSGSLTNWTSGDPLALLWFPTLTTASSAIAAGTPYGLYTRSTAVDGSSAWITPSDPSSAYKLLFYTKDGVDLSPGVSAANLGTAGNASLTVAGVPEPSRALLIAAGFGVMLMRRRRR